MGDLVQKKTVTPNYLTHAKKRNKGEEALIICRSHHSPIIERSLWETVQKELARRSRKKQGGSVQHGLSGKIRCGTCGHCFVCRQKKTKSGELCRVWACGNVVYGGKAACGVGKRLREEAALAMVRQAFFALSWDKEAFIHRLLLRLEEACSPKEELAALQRRLEGVRRKKEILLDAFLSGRVTAEELEETRARYNQTLSRLTQALAVCREKLPLRAEAGPFLQSVFSGEGLSDKLCCILTEEIVVCGDGQILLRLKGLPFVFCFEEAALQIKTDKTEAGPVC